MKALSLDRVKFIDIATDILATSYFIALNNVSVITVLYGLRDKRSFHIARIVCEKLAFASGDLLKNFKPSLALKRPRFKDRGALELNGQKGNDNYLVDHGSAKVEAFIVSGITAFSTF